MHNIINCIRRRTEESTFEEERVLTARESEVIEKVEVILQRIDALDRQINDQVLYTRRGGVFWQAALLCTSHFILCS